MEISYKEIKPIWIFPAIIFYIVALIFMATLYFSKNSSEVLFFSFILILLIVFSYYSRKKFSFKISSNNIEVSQLSLQSHTILPINQLNKIFIRMTPMDKFLHVSTLILEFDPTTPGVSSSEHEKVFGMPIHFGANLDHPGIGGNMLVIPGLSITKAKEIAEYINSKLAKQLPINNVSYGNPYYEFVSGINYLMNFAGLAIVFLILLLVLIIYIATRFYLK